MAERKNANCTICGKEYHRCASCDNTKSYLPWRTVTDTSECYKIYMLLHEYNYGYATKEFVKNKLKDMDLSELDTYVPEVKDVIKNILKEKETKIEKESKVEVEKDNVEQSTKKSTKRKLSKATDENVKAK